MTQDDTNNPYARAILAADTFASELMNCATDNAASKYRDLYMIARLVNRAQSVRAYASRLQRQIV